MSKSISHILLPMDGSKFSETALDPACSLAKAFGARILIYGCVSLSELIGESVETSAIAFSDCWEEKKNRLHYFLKVALLKVEQAGIEGHLRWSSGQPIDQILETCLIEKCDCIVMAFRGHSGLKRFFKGSVAEGVMRKAGCPVFLVPRSCVP